MPMTVEARRAWRERLQREADASHAAELAKPIRISANEDRPVRKPMTKEEKIRLAVVLILPFGWLSLGMLIGHH
jgi:hypothetical protein